MPAVAAGLVLLRVGLASAAGSPVLKNPMTDNVITSGSDAGVPLWAHPAEGIGVGVVIGLPTGINAAWKPEGPIWGQTSAAWSFESDSFALNVDVLYTVASPTAKDNADFLFPIYVGIGPRFRFGDAVDQGGYNQDLLGLRVPVGMCFTHKDFPLEGFLEFAPGVGLVPDTRGLFDVGLGLRLYLPGTGGR